MNCRAVLATAPNPGAIGIIEIEGDAARALRTLSGVSDWTPGRLRRIRFGDAHGEVDEGLAVLHGPRHATLMPHGGLRVVERLLAGLDDLGIPRRDAADGPAEGLFPEARDPCEALMLRTLGRAASPLAIDLLLDQPRRWRDPTIGEVAPDRAARLDRLVTPASVVVVGAPNVGKSTLGNALLGRRLSIPLDHPGTTRDYTAGLVDLDSLVVMWHDTPGWRDTDDPIEARAIALATPIVEAADLVIALTDHERDWPDAAGKADLRVGNKADLGHRADADLCISAQTGAGLAALVSAVRERLVTGDDRRDPGRWRFAKGLPGAKNGAGAGGRPEATGP